jgi:hypothetical protein
MDSQLAHDMVRRHVYACPWSAPYGWMTRLLSPPVAAPPTGSLLTGCQLAIAPATHEQAASADPIGCENQLPGIPQSVWDLSSGEGVNDPSSLTLGVTFTSDANGYAEAANPPLHALRSPVSSCNPVARIHRRNFA